MHVVGGVGLIDFFLFFIFLRVLYSAISRGIVCEAFKLLSLVIGSLLAFHYYSYVAVWLAGWAPFVSKKNCNGIAFLSILLSVTSIGALVRKIITLLFPPKELSALEKWIALFLGMVRFVFLASIIIYSACVLTGPGALVSQSVAFRVFRNVAPSTYEFLGSIVVSLSDRFPVNKEVRNCYETKSTV